MCYNDESKPSQAYANVPYHKTIQSDQDAMHRLQQMVNRSPSPGQPLNISREVIGNQFATTHKLVQEYEGVVTTLREVLGIQEPVSAEDTQPPAYTMAEMLARLNDRIDKATSRLEHTINRLSEALGGNIKILD